MEMPKARRVREALEARFAVRRQRGSHIMFDVHGRLVPFAYHDRRDLGEGQLRRIAKDFELTVEELKELL
ncbi:MAG: addiction module toxin, HicA family [Chloroflexi bacterium]|nr:addiction module toxin, HicA family [Chloroflexota bacterium]